MCAARHDLRNCAIDRSGRGLGRARRCPARPLRSARLPEGGVAWRAGRVAGRWPWRGALPCRWAVRVSGGWCVASRLRSGASRVGVRECAPRRRARRPPRVIRETKDTVHIDTRRIYIVFRSTARHTHATDQGVQYRNRRTGKNVARVVSCACPAASDGTHPPPSRHPESAPVFVASASHSP